MSCPIQSSFSSNSIHQIQRSLVDLAASEVSSNKTEDVNKVSFPLNSTGSRNSSENSTNSKVSPGINFWKSNNVPTLKAMPDVEFLPDAVLIVRNNDFLIIECNNYACKLFGYEKKEDLIGKSINVLVPTSYQERHSAKAAQVFDAMKHRVMGQKRSVKGLRADGSEFEVSIVLNPACIQIPGFEHYEKIVTCVCRDMTEHNQGVKVREEADRRDLAMEQFLRLINHEIRTAVHGVTNALSAVKADSAGIQPIQENLLAESKQNHKSSSLTLLEQSIVSMEVLLMNMVDYRNLKDGNLASQPSVVNCEALLNSLKLHQSPRWSAKSQLIEIKIEQEIPLIYTDAQLLNKLLSSLFDNAIKHSGANAKITLSCEIKNMMPQLAEISKQYSPILLHRSKSDIGTRKMENRTLSESVKKFVSLFNRTRAQATTSSSWPQSPEANNRSVPKLTPSHGFISKSDDPTRSTSPNLLDSPAILSNNRLDSMLPEQCDIQFIIRDDGPGLTETLISRLQTDAQIQGDATATRSTDGGLGLGFKIAQLCAKQLDADLIIKPNILTGKGTAAVLHLKAFSVSNIVQAPIEPLNTSISEDTQLASLPALSIHLFSNPLDQQAVVKQLLSQELAELRSIFQILIVEVSRNINVRICNYANYTNMLFDIYLVLVVCLKDNLVNMKVIRNALKKSGFSSLDDAKNGQVAVDLTMKKKYDLILMDIEMPVKDGLSATSDIRSNSQNPNNNTPIIALTANATNIAQNKCATVGMNLYLTKPLNTLDLMFSIAPLAPFSFYDVQYCPHILLYDVRASEVDDITLL